MKLTVLPRRFGVRHRSRTRPSEKTALPAPMMLILWAMLSPFSKWGGGGVEGAPPGTLWVPSLLPHQRETCVSVYKYTLIYRSVGWRRGTRASVKYPTQLARKSTRNGAVFAKTGARAGRM